MSSSYSHPSEPYQPPGSNLSRPLQPHQVTGYSSLAAWHGGHPPAYPPRGQPAPPPLQVPQPPAAHHLEPRPHQPLSGAVPPPIPNWNNRAPIPPSVAAPQQPDQGQLQSLGYPPSFATGRGELVTGTPSTCVCGASFNAPRERERHWVRAPSVVHMQMPVHRRSRTQCTDEVVSTLCSEHSSAALRILPPAPPRAPPQTCSSSPANTPARNRTRWTRSGWPFSSKPLRRTPTPARRSVPSWHGT